MKQQPFGRFAGSTAAPVNDGSNRRLAASRQSMAAPAKRLQQQLTFFEL